jgi:hypothetical protein
MKAQVTRFKNLKLCLKELEPFIRDGKHLQTGRAFKRFGGLRSRELLANWLLCVTLNFDRQSDQMIFTSDPDGGDGILHDTTTQESRPTEHVMVADSRSGLPVQIEAEILKAIEGKRKKGGKAYASGKILVVFVNRPSGPWFPNRIARQLPKDMEFDDVWAVGLQRVEDDSYVYGITQLDASARNAPTWLVRIRKDFEAWEVVRVQ